MTMREGGSTFDAQLVMCTQEWYIDAMELRNDRELSGQLLRDSFVGDI
jgi:hypothetical protein